ncbi:type II secretory pathway protein LspJ [Legionella quinlivanii]|uniref:Type II secretion system protein J n=1 Tax=Legionella quinlivanii TaxID=45073 RepID=A0A0W0Y4D2_9GAMM|nr:GspJ family T2SS minor pseudopilin variant LspJ [Legionella quinlivanii]KTD51568.1 type II secretory pathway protein LspJ [Legionella quinlivanii]MCW8450906.1 GspJ family T2SS minor pseudopilin variant LspJ [Legionella quinlivanii]SEF59299.1 general secretion pathway protein J [Legionella quinlivanii DSM 21216]STY10905.1 general secretion pathway protein J [Legionella quinlivanii]
MRVNKGFTLIEILIALAVFAIMATLTSSAMYYAFNTRSRVTEQAERLVDLQMAIIMIERDTEQITSRPVRGNEMRLFPAFTGQPLYLEFTRGGLTNPYSVEKKSSLRRIAWLCKGDKLIRRSWDALDAVNRNNYHDKTLLENMKNCKFAYLDENLQVLPEWRESSVSSPGNTPTLPKAVQLKIELGDWGTATFLFILPEGLYAKIA